MPASTGYLFGIFDLFNIAHLDTIRIAASRCDHLVVGVATDELVDSICGSRAFVPAIERIEIIRGVRLVGQVQALDSDDVLAAAIDAGAVQIYLPPGDLDVVQLAARLPHPVTGPEPTRSTRVAPRLVWLPAGRRTRSVQVRAALAATTTRSSVA